MIGATFVHIKHKRYKFMPVIILAFVLSLLVAYYRF
jgi:prepilin signal peptidase PulO-like enzyme (type II secretory pathway)